jgi:hypothetical protein
MCTTLAEKAMSRLRLSRNPEGSQCTAGDQMALDVERVVNCGMDTEEALRRSRRLEALRLLLPSSHHLIVAGVQGTELQHPSPDGLIRYLETAFR